MDRMPRVRLSLAATMSGVAVMGLALAAARTGWYFSFRALYTVTIVVLLYSAIAARYRPEFEAAFWFGFAVFGWGYFAAALGPWSSWGPRGSLVYPPTPVINHVLPTKEWVESMADSLAIRMRMQSKDVSSPDFNAPYWTLWSSLIGIGHLLFVWICGLVGGWVSTIVAWRSKRR
jgi:hypothetical protein